MTLKHYTLRGRHTGHFYYATGHTFAQACREIGIKPRDLILEKSEKIPAQPPLEPQEQS